jgi:hypothetical protein
LLPLLSHAYLGYTIAQLESIREGRRKEIDRQRERERERER